MALAHFEQLGREERARIERFAKTRGEALEQVRIAGDAARFEQGGPNRHVGRGLVETLFDCPHAAADVEAEIPGHADEAFDAQFDVGLRRILQQHEDVDVRVGREFAAAIAADGDECGRVRQPATAPCAGQHAVDLTREAVRERIDMALREEGLDELGLGSLELSAQCRGIGDRLRRCTALGERRVHAVAASRYSGRAWTPAERVSTS